MIARADNDDSDRLMRLANEIADGEDVDWDTADSTASNDDERELMRQMRAVDEIAHAHRDQQAADPVIPSEPLLPTRWGKLELLEKIGRGAFGEVYRAHEAALDREVALKLIREEDAEPTPASDAILEEGRLLARFAHENVARVHGAERHAGRVGIWMELIQGQTLAEILDAQGRMSPDEAVHIGRDLCRAVAAIHGAGVIHRDIKSTNVMRQEGGRIILMDLGTGSELRDPGIDDGVESVERSGDESHEEGGRPSPSMAGTPLYMAPETLLRREVTTRSDIYSLGVLLFHLVTRTYPIKGRNLRQLRDAHERGTARSLLDERPDLPDGFVRVVERALDPDPERRFASAGELERALAGVADAATDEPWWQRWLRALRTRPRVRVLSVACATLVVLLAVGGTEIFQSWMGRHYSVDAIFYRLPVPDHTTRERLVPGDELQLDDWLMLEIEGSKDLFVYVLSEDDRGEAYLLFPNAWSAQQNPIPAASRIQLPGVNRHSGKEFFWVVTTTAGSEHIVVVASPRRLPDVERELQSMQSPSLYADASGSPYPSLPDRVKRRFRGLGGLAESQSGSPELPTRGGRLAAITRRFDNGKETLDDDEIWMRRIDLDYATEPSDP